MKCKRNRKNLKNKFRFSIFDFRFLRKKGFTLVEAIIYIAIASIFFTTAIGFFWKMRMSEAQAHTSAEVRENTAQALETFKYYMRNAQDVNTGSSDFGVNPGTLELVYADGDWIFDTYTKDITAGSVTKTIRKLRLTHDGGQIYDLTSDHVDVTGFELTNLTQGDEPDAVRMELEIVSANPGNSADYDDSLSVATTVNVREESLVDG